MVFGADAEEGGPVAVGVEEGVAAGADAEKGGVVTVGADAEKGGPVTVGLAPRTEGGWRFEALSEMDNNPS